MRLRVLVGCWLAAWIGVVTLLTMIAPLWSRFYERFGIELPYVTARTLTIGEALASSAGGVLVALTLGLGLLPLRLARGSPAVSWWFGGNALVAVVVASFAWLALELPLFSIHYSFVAPGPFQLAIERRPSMLVLRLLGELPGWLCAVGSILAWPWVSEVRQVARHPRGPLLVELRHALVLCSLPALVLGCVAFAAGELGYAPDGLVIAPSMAAAGTVVVVLFAAALWLRLRRPVTDDLSAPSPPT